MARYSFEAKALDGRSVKGELEANSDVEARGQIRSRRLTPLSVALKEVTKTKKLKVKAYDLQVFTRQFAVMTHAGISIMKSLETLALSTKSLGLLTIINYISQNIERGSSLSESLATYPYVFDKVYINLVKAGEESGDLSGSLNGLSDFLERRISLRRKVKGAMYYPIVVLLVVSVVVTALMLFIVPKFASIFGSAGAELPALTQFVLSISNWLQGNIIFLLFAIVTAGVGCVFYYRTEDGRITIEGIILKAPIFGDLAQKSALARFSRTISRLLSAGVSFLNSIQIASAACGNIIIEKNFLKVKGEIQRGKTFASSLNGVKYVPSMVVQMIAVGEETGNVGGMLDKVADFYEEEIEVTINSLSSLIEPVLMLILGVAVGIIFLAMYLPIFNLGNVLG